MHWYYVEPTSDDKWQVLAEGHSEPRVFERREEAVTTAERYARGNFAANGLPSGVRIRQGGLWRDDEVFAEGRGRRRS